MVENMMAPIVLIGGRPKHVKIPESGVYPIVVYVPKYDSKLREEFEIRYRDGKYHIYITRKGNKICNIYIGAFDDMSLVREICLEQFDLDFNRDPKGRRHVWERTKAGRETISSVSLHEGSKLISATVTHITIGKPKKLKGVHTYAGKISELYLRKNIAKVKKWKEEQLRKLIQQALKKQSERRKGEIRNLVKKTKRK